MEPANIVPAILIFDIDGVLVGGPNPVAPDDLRDFLACLADFVGPKSLLTTAGGAYALAIDRVFHIRAASQPHIPLLAEGGGFLLDPAPDGFRQGINWGWRGCTGDNLAKIQSKLYPMTHDILGNLGPRASAAAGSPYVEPKRTGMTINLADRKELRSFLAKFVRETGAELGIQLEVTDTSSTIEVMAGGGKGSGYEYLREFCLSKLSCPVFYIGDSLSDMPVLRLADFVACPGNAQPEVLTFVRERQAKGEGHAAASPFLRGVVEALRAFHAWVRTRPAAPDLHAPRKAE